MYCTSKGERSSHICASKPEFSDFNKDVLLKEGQALLYSKQRLFEA